MNDSNPQGRYFFVHIQKTAGSAFRRLLMNHFGEEAVYPARGMDGTDPVELVLSIDHLRERFAARGDRIQVVTGHFPLCVADLLGGKFKTLTILREPVERTLSYLRHHREQARKDRDKSLEAIYDDEFQFHALVHNHMTKMLALTPAEMTGGMLTRLDFTHDHLERAKERLAGMDAVGFQEHFQDFCDELSQRFGWRLGDPETMNTTRPSDVPPSFRTRISEDNALDVELYEFATHLGRERVVSAGLDHAGRG